MKKTNKIMALTATVLLGAMMTLRAGQINGNISFFGTANLDTSSAGTATAVTAWHGNGGVGDPVIADATGDFVPYVTLGVTTATFAAPWSFNSGAVPGFWSAGGFTFALTQSAISIQGGSPAGVTVTGTGFISGNGFDSTPGIWGFSSQDPSAGSPARFTFSAAANATPCTGQIGDYVWNDLNMNGCQDTDEPGISNVVVTLYRGCDANKVPTAIQTTITGSTGHYLFTGLCAGDYTVNFTTPSGFVHTAAHQGCGGTPGDVHNPNDSNCECTGNVNCDVCVTLATDDTQDLTIDCGYYGSTPCIDFTKTADTNSAVAGGQMGYTYALTNCGGTTYSNLAIVDDAGTPDFPGDDFTVGSGITLLPGQGTNIHVVVNLPIVTCVSNSNPSITAGLLITQVLPNGNIKVDYRQSRDLNDNVYGAPAAADGWSSHKFSDLTGSDKAEFQFTDGTGKVVLDFYSDYISAATKSVTPMGTILYPSGYGSLGPNGGDGKMILGSSNNVVWWSTTLTSNLNSGLNGGFPSPYTTNSPTPEASFPNWDYVDGFSVIVSSNAFGAAGFGGVTIPYVHNSPAKTGNNQVSPVPCSGCITNTATVYTTDASGGILTTVASDDAVVCTGTPAPQPSTCLITKGAFKIDKNTIQLPLKNAGAANIVLSEVDLTWNQAVNGRITKMSLNGDFWTGPAAGSPIAITSGFNTDANRRTIAKGQTKTLVLTFEHPASKVLSDYTGGAAKFGTCVVTIP